METNDEVVERQKLVTNEIEEEPSHKTNHRKKQEGRTSAQSTEEAQEEDAVKRIYATVPKINIKSISSGETTRSRNSASCSIERTISERDQQPTKVTYVNERRPRLQMHGDERFEFKSRPRKLLKESLNETISKRKTDDDADSKQSLNNITLVGSEWSTTANAIEINDSIKINEPHDETLLSRRKRKTSGLSISALSDKFDDRPIKHHSFVSEVPDVKHMERALLGLLDDFHSGKLKAFGSGCTMAQMTKIREQQESLAKLHFEVAAAEEDALEQSNEFNATRAQENMLQLMQRLEQLSISIEQLQTNHSTL